MLYPPSLKEGAPPRSLCPPAFFFVGFPIVFLELSPRNFVWFFARGLMGFCHFLGPDLLGLAPSLGGFKKGPPNFGFFGLGDFPPNFGPVLRLIIFPPQYKMCFWIFPGREPYYFLAVLTRSGFIPSCRPFLKVGVVKLM